MKKVKKVASITDKKLNDRFDELIQNDPQVKKLLEQKRKEKLYDRVAEPNQNTNHPQQEPHITTYKKKKSKGRLWGIKGFAPINQFVFIVSEVGFGKTTLGIYLALMNMFKKPFWSRDDNQEDLIPIGRGKRTLYIQSERIQQDIIDQVYANGGNGDEIVLLDEFKDGKGNIEYPDLDNPQHYKALINKIKLESGHPDGLDFLVFDSILELLQSIINDVSKVKKRMRQLLKDIEPYNLTIICMAHMRKERMNVDSLNSLFGSVGQIQFSTGIWKIRKKKDGSGYILALDKCNWHKNNRQGGFEYKIVSKAIPDQHLDKDSEIDDDDKEFGGIESLNYLDLSHADLLKLCEADNKSEIKKEIPYNTIKRTLENIDEISRYDLEKKLLQRGMTPNFMKYNLVKICDSLGYCQPSGKPYYRGQGDKLGTYFKKNNTKN